MWINGKNGGFVEEVLANWHFAPIWRASRFLDPETLEPKRFIEGLWITG